MSDEKRAPERCPPHREIGSLKAALNFTMLLSALLTVAGVLITVGAWAQYHFAGQKAVEKSLCVAYFHAEYLALRAATDNAYARYIKAKSEKLIMETRLVLLDNLLPDEEKLENGAPSRELPKEWGSKDDIRRLAVIQEDRMKSAKADLDERNKEAGEWKQSFDSGKICPDKRGILWPTSS